jgi:hypothetical protein
VLLDGFSLTVASLIFGIIAVTDQCTNPDTNMLLWRSLGAVRNLSQLGRIDISFRSRLHNASTSKLSWTNRLN